MKIHKTFHSTEDKNIEWFCLPFIAVLSHFFSQVYKRVKEQKKKKKNVLDKNRIDESLDIKHSSGSRIFFHDRSFGFSIHLPNRSPTNILEINMPFHSLVNDSFIHSKTQISSVSKYCFVYPVWLSDEVLASGIHTFGVYHLCANFGLALFEIQLLLFLFSGLYGI